MESSQGARVRVWRYQRNLDHGIEFLLSRKRSMVAPTILIFLDWLFTLAILYCAFLVGNPPDAADFVRVEKIRNG